MALTEKQKIFADEYLKDLNATRAYKAAYPRVKKEETAAVNGSKLLRNTKVAEYIDKRMQERQARTEVTQDKVVKELAAMAFADITDFVEIENGAVRIKNTSDIVPEKLKAVTGIKEGANGIEIKLGSKEKTLELLGRHLGMFKDKVEVSGLNDEKSKLDNILKQMRGGDG